MSPSPLSPSPLSPGPPAYPVDRVTAQDDDNTFFHVSSKFSSKDTSSQRFVDNIDKALMDLRALWPADETPAAGAAGAAGAASGKGGAPVSGAGAGKAGK